MIRFWRRRGHDRDALVCREFVELVTDYLDGALSDGERVRFESHLAACDGCTGYLADFRHMIETMRELPEPPPDAATHEALLHAFRDLRGSA